jgi:hypothetical protein
MRSEAMTTPEFPKHLIGSFDPAIVNHLVAAFADAWRFLEASGVNFGTDERIKIARETLAASIIDAAKLGERDETKLSDAALARWATHNVRSDRPRRPTESD